MAEVVTTKQLNLDRLTAELGGVGLKCVGDYRSTEEKKVSSDGATQPQLEAAVAAHVYDPTWTPPPSAEQTNLATIQQQVTLAMATLQSIIDTPQVTIATVAQAQPAVRGLQSQVKDLARIQRRLIRLVTGDLSGSD